MIKDYIRRIAIKDYSGMKTSIVRRSDRIGRPRARYDKYSTYREIQTYDSKIDGVTRHMVYRHLTFRPETYADLVHAVGVRYIGHRAHRGVKKRSLTENCPGIKYQYASIRGMSTVNVDRDNDGQFTISFNHNII